jgi:hypothetical protein
VLEVGATGTGGRGRRRMRRRRRRLYEPRYPRPYTGNLNKIKIVCKYF